jgi:hypothetical protein
MNDQSITKLEFLLKLGDNIVCQRYFNVIGYNPLAKNSIDLYEYIKSICDNITTDLKIKNDNYLIENKNLFFSPNYNNDMTDAKEPFILEIKNGDEVIIKRMISTYYFHPTVRFVDIRPILRTILGNLTIILSTKNLEYNFLKYNLKNTLSNFEIEKHYA